MRDSALTYAKMVLLPQFSILAMFLSVESTECAGQALCINPTARKRKNFSLEASGKSTLEALKS